MKAKPDTKVIGWPLGVNVVHIKIVKKFIPAPSKPVWDVGTVTLVRKAFTGNKVVYINQANNHEITQEDIVPKVATGHVVVTASEDIIPSAVPLVIQPELPGIKALVSEYVEVKQYPEFKQSQKIADTKISE